MATRRRPLSAEDSSLQCHRCGKQIEKGTGYLPTRTEGRFNHVPRCIPRRRGTKAFVEEMRAEVAALRALVAENKPITLRVEQPKKNGAKPIDVKNAHAQLPELIKHASARCNVYLYGLPGGGKTTGAMHAAKALGLQYGYVSLDPQTPKSHLVGYMDVSLNQKGDGQYRSTPFFKCYTEGGLFCIDELDNASASLLTTLNGMIENDLGAFPHGVFPRHEDFVLIATGNTTGRGGDVLFPERRILDAATIDRFVYMDWGYDLGLETNLTISANPKATPWLTWVRSARAFCLREKIRLFFTPRASIRGAKLLADSFFTADMVADRVGFRGISADVKARVLAACPLPTEVMA